MIDDDFEEDVGISMPKYEVHVEFPIDCKNDISFMCYNKETAKHRFEEQVAKYHKEDIVVIITLYDIELGKDIDFYDSTVELL